MGQYLSERHQIRLAQADTAAGTSDVVSGIIDLQALGNFKSVCFTFRMATDASGNYATIQHADTVSGGSSANGVITGATALTADVASSRIDASANGDIIVMDLKNCTKRYLQMTVKRGTSTAVSHIAAICYDGLDQPVTIPTNVIVEQWNGALSGTA